MDLKFDIEEIKSCTLRIEERVNELSTQSPKCQSCCKVIQLRTAIQNIGSRLDNLASTSEADVNPYEHRFKKIQEQITELKERILVCQPDQDRLDDVLAAHRASTKRGTRFVETDSANTSTHDGSSRLSTSESSLPCTTKASTDDKATSNIPNGVNSSQSETTDTIEARDPHRSDSQMATMRTRRVTFLEPLASHTVRQTTNNFLRMDIWKALAQRHLDAALQSTGDLECVVSVLLLDISESMATGEAWKQTKTFVKDFLKGLKEVKSIGDEHLKDEYVSVATYGHETKLQMPLTSNYDSVQEFVDRLTLGGPSPLYGGLWMGLAGAMSCKKGRFKNNGIIIHPKIIVLSDCRPTETLLIEGPDDPDMEKTDETLVNVMSALDHLDRRGISVFVVPVGDYDQEFVNIIKPAGRRLYKHTEGRRLARRNYISAKTDLIGFRSLFTDTFSLEDMEDMHEIRMESWLGLSLDQADRSTVYKESTSKMFPPIGSRVRRGPDWHWKDQDHGGPGTVVGHAED
ncbi:uncharacterized protein LOC127879107 [Dreissena polymorpha]|nr:uncharacterized protein LOC127879107 [Dreissena polymorpha]